MALTRTVAPAALPLAWDQVKGHLRLDSEDERSRIEEILVPAACSWAETFTGRVLITQTWKWLRSGFPVSGFLALPRPPLQTLTAIRYIDTNGVQQTWAPAKYVVDAPVGEKAMPGRVWPAYGESWPTVRTQPNAVEIEFVCGYGAAAGDVPGLLRAAMLLIVGELFERREQAVQGTIITEVPLSAERLAGQFLVTV